MFQSVSFVETWYHVPKMAWATNDPVFGRATDNIFSSWISPSHYTLPANDEETINIRVASEITCHLLDIALPMLHF